MSASVSVLSSSLMRSARCPLPVRLYTFQENHRARSFYERHGFKVIELTDGSANEERCPDVLYEYGVRAADGA